MELERSSFPIGEWFRLALALAGTAPAFATAASVGPHPIPAPASVSRSLPSEARRLVQWVERTGDNAGLPFIVIDKRAAQLWVMDGERRVVDSTPVLLGLARGDLSVPGIGERPIAGIRPEERTTPAGRFVAEPGRNASGEDIFWVDYDAAVSLHRVRTGNPAEARLQRLATPTFADNRISYGCINVPAAFYDRRIRTTFGTGTSRIYVLPETLPFARFFAPSPLPPMAGDAAVGPAAHRSAAPSAASPDGARAPG